MGRNETRCFYHPGINRGYQCFLTITCLDKARDWVVSGEEGRAAEALTLSSCHAGPLESAPGADLAAARRMLNERDI